MEQASLEEPAGSSLRSEKLSSVIDVLPPEILGHIIECTAQPEEARQVLRLTHVSTLWQSITLSYSRLFTNADWGRWAPQLIQLWCERAKYRSLSIYLDNITLLEISRELGGKAENDVSLPKYQRRLGTLRQAIPYAESLDVESFDEPRREDWHPEDNPLTILCPNLCWLSISSVHIRSEIPLVELNTLIFSDIDTDEAPEVMWPTLYDRIFTLCPAVTDITFTLSTEARIIGPKLSLPKVRRLSLHRRGDENYTFLPYQSMLDLFQFPSLVELSITIDWIPLDDVSGLLAVLPISISRLHFQSIRPHSGIYNPLTIVKELLSRSGRLLLVPKLCHFQCSTPHNTDWKGLFGYLLEQPQLSELENALAELLEERKLAQVRLPVIRSACIEALTVKHNVIIESELKC